MHSIESRCAIGPENVLFGMCVRAFFSPEILHAGAVKGLKVSEKRGLELRSCVGVEVAILGSLSRIVCTVSVDVKQR